jgi:hypothetical protein
MIERQRIGISISSTAQQINLTHAYFTTGSWTFRQPGNRQFVAWLKVFPTYFCCSPALDGTTMHDLLASDNTQVMRLTLRQQQLRGEDSRITGLGGQCDSAKPNYSWAMRNGHAPTDCTGWWWLF